MRSSTLWRLAIVTLALGAAVWLTRRDPAGRAALVNGGRVFMSDPEDVTELGVTGQGLALRLVRKDHAWFLDAPVRARADELAVDRILATLDGIAIVDRISVAERKQRELSLQDYGLAAPRLSFRLVSPRGSESLGIGTDAPLGARVFAQREGSGDILLIARDVLEVVPASAAALRYRGLVRGALDKVTRLDIQRATRGFVQLMRQDGVWRLQQPVAALADQAAVRQLLQGLFDARIATFVWDAVPDESGTESAAVAKAQFESCGLSDDVAPLRIGMWLEGDRLGQELICGRQLPDDATLVYARRRDVPAVYAIDAAVPRLFDVQAHALRDRRIFPEAGDRTTGLTIRHGETKLVLERTPDGWMVREPVQWKADPEVVGALMPRLAALRAKAYVSAEPTNLVAVGLTPPAYVVELRTGGTDTNRLAVGTVVEPGGTVYGRQAERDELVALAGPDVAWLAASGTDPLHYRDRTVLALAPETVWRLSRQVGKSVQVVERVNGGGAWQVAEAGRGSVATQTVHAVLLRAANLRALRIECRGPDSLAPFGLDDSAVALTFGLRGDAGIRKTLLLGFLSLTDGIYAMIRGQDVVFVLDRSQVEDLMHELVIADRELTPAAGSPGRSPLDGPTP
jgi:hypothetical protein